MTKPLRKHDQTARGVRRDLGISQAKLALLLGVHSQTVAKWEHGTLAPTEHQQSLMNMMANGHRKHRRDLNAWLANRGWMETLAYLLASAYGFEPEAEWRKV